MLVVQLKGGLGNQMFQYAFGRALSIKNKKTVIFDRSLLDHSNLYKNSTHRQYELGRFGLNLIFSLPEHQMANYLKSAGIFSRITLRFKRRLGHLKMIKEKNFCFSAKYLGENENRYFSGYWQSPLYFEKYRKEILEDFSFFPQSGSDEYLFFQEKIKNAICPVALHVRRGDYVSNLKDNSTHGVVGIPYFSEAIVKLLSLEPAMEIFVFSDDIAWCKDNLKKYCPMTFVTIINPQQNFFLEFSLMRQCHHFIISNSTFSWWAAWLSENPKKIVFAPKTWFLNQSINKQTESLFPKEWIRI